MATYLHDGDSKLTGLRCRADLQKLRVVNSEDVLQETLLFFGEFSHEKFPDEYQR